MPAKAKITDIQKGMKRIEIKSKREEIILADTELIERRRSIVLSYTLCLKTQNIKSCQPRRSTTLVNLLLVTVFAINYFQSFRRIGSFKFV